MEEEGGRGKVVERACAFARQTEGNTFRRGGKGRETSPPFRLRGELCMGGTMDRCSELSLSQAPTPEASPSDFIEPSQPLYDGRCHLHRWEN